MNRTLIAGLALVAGLGVADQVSAAMLSLRFEPSSQTINVGQTATIDIFADLDGSHGLSAFDFGYAVGGDAGVVGGGSFDLNESLFSSPGTSFGGVSGFNLLSPPTGSVFLGSIEFTGAAVGIATVDADDAGSIFTGFTLVDGFDIVSLGFLDPEVDLSAASATIEVIQVIPLPAPLAMAGIGLLGAAVARRRLRGSDVG